MDTLYIIEIYKEKTDGPITYVKVRLIYNDLLETTGIITKENIIHLLKNGATIKTSYKNNNGGEWIEGADVYYYTDSKNNEMYLKTDADHSALDNLDNLPPFSF